VWKRGARRAAPFLAVAVCFLLPFSSASSCGSGISTDATGVDIVTGSRLVARQTEQPMCFNTDNFACPSVRLGRAVGPDPVAQAVSHAAQPWAIVALVLVLAGACLVVLGNRVWRAASLITAGAALFALFQMGSTFHTPRHAEDVSPDVGLIVAIIILGVTIIWVGVLAIKAANADLTTTPVPAGHDPPKRSNDPASHDPGGGGWR
jgi:hypothetical protein